MASRQDLDNFLCAGGLQKENDEDLNNFLFVEEEQLPSLDSYVTVGDQSPPRLTTDFDEGVISDFLEGKLTLRDQTTHYVNVASKVALLVVAFYEEFATSLGDPMQCHGGTIPFVDWENTKNVIFRNEADCTGRKTRVSSAAGLKATDSKAKWLVQCCTLEFVDDHGRRIRIGEEIPRPVCFPYLITTVT